MTAQCQGITALNKLFGFIAIATLSFVLIVALSKPESVFAACWIFFAQIVLIVIWASPVPNSTSLLAAKIAKNKREQIRCYVEERFVAAHLGKLQAKNMELAEYSYQIATRRLLYRKLDCLLWLMSIRYIPKEFSENERKNGCPKLSDETQDPDSQTENGKQSLDTSAMSTNWKALFVEITTLIRHDDTLNWQKFNYVLVVFGALLTAYVVNFSQPSGNSVLCVGLGLIGVLLAWGADLTFQEGLRCLRAHRRKQAILEEQAPPYEVSFLYSGSSFNQRDVLEAAPMVIFLLSFFLIVVAVIRFFVK